MLLKLILISDVILTTHTKSGIPICSATSGGMDKMKKIMPYIYTSPIEVMEIEDKSAALYLHALFAIKYRKLMYIGGVFISSVLDFFRTIENSFEDLINDLRKGRINSKLNISNDLRIKINSYLTPDNYLADKLQSEFNKGLKGIATRLWPNLAYIISVSGANFSIYEDAVKYYTGSTIIYSPSIAATEGFIGINPYVDETKYVITPDTAFFELINIKDSNKDNPKTYTIDTAIENDVYEIILTTFSGLYRYKLNDVVKVTGHYNNSLEVQFLYRKNQILNMVSEKTTEKHVTSALKDFSEKEKISITDFTTMSNNSITPGKYTFFIEFDDKTILNNTNINNLEISLDNALKKANPAYNRFRNSNMLSNIEIKPVKKETFSKIKEKMMSKGTSKNQIKIPRVINNNKSLVNLLQNNVINNSII